MEIILYPHLTLRHKSKPLKRVDATLRDVVEQMFELMYQANGVGLAANQVNLPLRLFVCNLAAQPDDGEQCVFINPVITSRKGASEREEGCLSLPELFGSVKRPERVTVEAYSLAGKKIQIDTSGMMARVIQHEIDHLDGVLFIDRMTESAKSEVSEQIRQFEDEFVMAGDRGLIPVDEEIVAHLAEMEARYC